MVFQKYASQISARYLPSPRYNLIQCGIFDSASTSRNTHPSEQHLPLKELAVAIVYLDSKHTGIISRSGYNVLARLIGRVSILAGMECNVSRLASAASSSTSPPHCPSILDPSIGIHVD